MNEEVKLSSVHIHSRADELIACLEGEIAKRDERIVGLESQYQRDVWGLNNEGDPIGGDPAGGYANDNARLRTELAALKAQCVVMPEHETPAPSSKWAAAGEPDPHGKAYDCERAELSMGEYTDDELANAVFMHDHRSFDIAATMRGEPGSIVLLTAAKDRIRWLSRSLDKELARLKAAPVQQPKCKTCDDNGLIGGPGFYSPDEGGDPCPDCCAPVQQVSVPDGWKLVPVEPTPEMVFAAEEAHMPFGDMDIALRMAILSAPSAPATVQGVNQRLLEALELAANRLDRLALEQGEFWRGYATAWADEARATANGVKS